MVALRNKLFEGLGGVIQKEDSETEGLQEKGIKLQE